jgi:hypothetical protein
MVTALDNNTVRRLRQALGRTAGRPYTKQRTTLYWRDHNTSPSSVNALKR